MYTAVVLDSDSQNKLKNFCALFLPASWDLVCHHMTTNMGGAVNGPAHAYLGQKVALKATHFAKGLLVAAVLVECEVPSTNANKHVTLAVDKANGGKPVMSNKLSEWEKMEDISLTGTVMEVL